MQYRLVIYVLGWLLVFFSVSMAPSLAVSFIYGDGGGVALGLAMLITAIAGAGLAATHHPGEGADDITPRDGFLIVSGGWFLCGLFGALPFVFAHTFAPEAPSNQTAGLWLSFSNSVFEALSGLTTTGASVLTDFEQPHAIMFWRSTTHWLGGMGIIVLSLAILPLIGAGGMQLFKSEAPGPVQDRLKPRIADTAITLSKVYVLLTVLQTIALWFCGMSVFDALCHTFGTVATGGFSTHSLSVGGYNNSAVNYVISFFMILAGANFALHYRFLKGQTNSYFKSAEFRAYFGIIIFSTLALTYLVYFDEDQPTLLASFEHGLFQAASIMTTTGFATADFEVWHPLAQVGLFLLMFVGGCAGSTGGGIKVVRVVLLAKIAYREMYRLLYPAAVVMVKMDEKTVPDKVLSGISGFFILTSAVFILSILILSAHEIDFVTSMSATAACLFNIGPGLGAVGPYDNYAGLPILIKWWLAFCMVVGRLEFYSVLILTAPDFWRR
ncbi:TrkH family potassium uptake protein [bacterium]|nr:TrkH family potassium uptake protein [bacterium]